MSSTPLLALVARCRALCRPRSQAPDAQLSLTSTRIRACLWAKTMQVALYTPAPAIVALAESALPALKVAKDKLLVTALLMTVSAAGVAGKMLTAKPLRTSAAIPSQAQAAAEPKKSAIPQVRRDRHGDPLPDGAIARLGTVRWRHGFFVDALAYSPNGKMIAAAGIGRSITLWDAATGKEVRQFPNCDRPLAVAFAPDSKILASADTRICHLWDIATGKELWQLKGHTKRVCGLVFAPDGKTLATVGADETASLWDSKDGRELRQLDCKQGYLNAVAYSPDGKFLATAGKDGTIRLWDSATGRESRQLNGHIKEVWKIVFSPDGTRLASSGADRTIRLWDMATARQIRIFREKMGNYNLPIAFSPDGTLLASGVGGGLIRLWDVSNGTEKRQWQAGAMDVRAIAFSPDGKTLASGAAWESIRLWDAATGREHNPSEGHLGVIEFVRFSPDGASLVSISRERRLVWWDLATQTPRRQFIWQAPGISRTALSADSKTLAVGSWSDSEARKVHLWDLRTGKLGRQLGEPQPRFSSIAFSPDSRLVASEGPDQSIHIWDARNGVEVRRITGIVNGVARLCFSPDSKTLACSRRDAAPGEPTLRLWNVGSGKECCRFDCRVSVFALAFSPDGKVLATGDAYDREDWLVRLWDTATGKELSCHRGHRDEIAAVAFSPDGKLMASGAGSSSWECKDNSVRVWEAATGRLIRRFEGQHSCVLSVAFSPDGRSVASGAGDSTILLWDITGRQKDGKLSPIALTSRQMDVCWKTLADEDAAKAYDAMWSFIAAGEQAAMFLHKHLPPVPHPDAKTIARLIADLDSSDFAVRDKATKELDKLGDTAAPALRQALESKPSLEMRRRLQQLLDQTRDWTAERLRAHRAIQALEHIGTPSAKKVLQALADGAPQSHRTEEAKAVLRRMAR